MANQVSNVLKRVHEAAAQSENGAKRCRYENSDDVEMDVDLNNLFTHQSYNDEQQSKQHQQQQQDQTQDMLQQQQLGQQEYSSRISDSQSQSMANIFQDQTNEFCTMGHNSFGLNSNFNQKLTKTEEFPETIDDVEYMYQTTHGGDFMRHLNNYPGADL